MSYLSSAVSRGAARFGIVLPATLVAFLGVGMAGLAMHTSVFTLLFWLHADKSLAWFAGLVTATVLTWVLNRRFTFAASGRRRRSEMARYALVTAVAQSVSFAVFHLALWAAPAVPPSIDVIAGAVVATLFSYTGQRFFTFSRVGSPSTDPTSEPKA